MAFVVLNKSPVLPYRVGIVLKSRRLLWQEGAESMRVQELDVVLDEDGRNILVKGHGRNLSEIGRIRCPQEVAVVMERAFGLQKRAEEYVYLVCMTRAGKPIGFFEVAHGTCDMALVNPREVLVRCLLCGATSMVLVHNHPGGSILPSKSDKAVTESLKEACRLVGVGFTDHIIVAQQGSYYSFREAGEMDGGSAVPAPSVCGCAPAPPSPAAPVCPG